MSAESFQRFESQKVVGKNYPWFAPHQVQIRSTTFRRTLSAPGEIVSSTTNNGENKRDEHFRKTLNVNVNNFNEREEEKNVKKFDFVSNITDDDKLNSIKQADDRVPDEIDGTKFAIVRILKAEYLTNSLNINFFDRHQKIC